MGGAALRLRHDHAWRVVNLAVTLGSRVSRREERWHEAQRSCEFLGFELLSPVGQAGHALERIHPTTAQDAPAHWAQAVDRLVAVMLKLRPRVVLAPIFMLWFGLGIWSKVALGVTLVFFIVFFNVYQGVKEVSPVVLANARMLGASNRQLLRHVYLPSATSWVFSSLHTSVGLAFVGAVVGEYLGSSQGVGYLILQAEGTFDINTVMAGILVLTAFALVLDAAVGKIERRLMKWQPKSGETEKL